jgi:hypothetical protein
VFFHLFLSVGVIGIPVLTDYNTAADAFSSGVIYYDGPDSIGRELFQGRVSSPSSPTRDG